MFRFIDTRSKTPLIIENFAQAPPKQPSYFGQFCRWHQISATQVHTKNYRLTHRVLFTELHRWTLWRDRRVEHRRRQTASDLVNTRKPRWIRDERHGRTTTGRAVWRKIAPLAENTHTGRHKHRLRETILRHHKFCQKPHYIGLWWWYHRFRKNQRKTKKKEDYTATLVKWREKHR